MSSSPLHQKTIRPGSLNGYSYYYSSRQRQSVSTVRPKAKQTASFKLKHVLIVLLLIAVPVIGFKMQGGKAPDETAVASTAGANDSSKNDATKQPVAGTAAKKVTNYCAGNALDQLVKISVSKRHAWMCEGERQVYDTPVITGMLIHPETLTPPGTYKIYGKQQDTRLTGADSAGAWDYPVAYWMPFLSNQHGVYGFHDATWRSENEFGKVDPNTDKASHGCIELPSAAMAWLFHWSKVGTTLTVEN